MRIPINVQDYVDLINDGIPFAQANYGDGEWACILGMSGQNCNGERYTPLVQEALIDTIQNPPPGHMWYGSNGGKKLEPTIRGWLLDRGLTQRAWVYKEIISGANVNGKLKPFIEAVRRRRTILVGPDHLHNEELMKIWGIKGFAKVPTADAMLAFDRTWDRTLGMVNEYDAEVALVCSGMAANPLITKLARHKTMTVIDMGATLDPYAGVFSRSGYRKDAFQKTAYAKNIEGLIQT